MSAVGVFFAMFALDFVWALYTRAITDSRAVMAGTHATLITALNGAVVIGFIADHFLLLPACAGAFVGTIAAVWFGYLRSVWEWFLDFVEGKALGRW